MSNQREFSKKETAAAPTLVLGFLPLPVLLGIGMSVAFYYALLGAQMRWEVMANIIAVVLGVFFLNAVWKRV